MSCERQRPDGPPPGSVAPAHFTAYPLSLAGAGGPKGWKGNRSATDISFERIFSPSIFDFADYIKAGGLKHKMDV